MLMRHANNPAARIWRHLAALALLCFTSAVPLRAQEFRAAWADVFHVGMGSQGEVDDMVSTLVSGHYNAVVVQVLAYMDSNGTASHGARWKSNILPWSTIVSSSFDPLAYLCTQAHANGIEVHAWLGGSAGAMYRVSTTWPPAGNSTLATNKWLIAPLANSEGGAPVQVDGNYDLDMGSPDAQEYIVSIVRELVANYPIDGINWDDELNGAGYDAGFGYPAYSQADYPRSGLARFRINTGYVGTPSNTNTAWSDYRRRFKNEVMARVQAEIQSIKTNPRQPLRHTSAALAYSPVPSSCDFSTSAPYLYFCDWAGMLQHGWVDAVIPQTYSSGTFSNWADRIAACWQYDRQVFPGIGAYLQTDATIAGEIAYTRDKGLKGNCIYSYAAPNSAGNNDWWAYAAANVYTDVVSTPSMPWRNPATATEGIVWGRVTDANTGSYVDDATVAVTDGPTVQTDGNGYYVATLVTATASGTVHSVTVSKTGMTSQTITAIALAGDVARYDLALNPAPSITAQPQSQMVALGDSVTFSVAATGATPLYYQWRFNTANIAGATAPSYTLQSAQATNAGDYSVIVTNAFGSATSSNGTLVVDTNIIPAAITSQPQNQTVIAGQAATFTVTASGTKPLSYQWQFNEVAIPGATASAYTRTNIQTSDAGSYSVVVTNAGGSATGTDAVLTVNFSLTATAGTGGSVSKSPDQTSYSPNSVVTLTATANQDYLFTGWSGDANGTNSPIAVTMTTNKAVTASFMNIATDFVVDNTDAAASFTGSWTTATAATNKYGPDYQWALTAAGGTNTATYRPSIYTPGYYNVYVWYPQGGNRATNAPWSVVCDGGSINVAVNQQVNGGQWLLIGRALPFATGTGGYVLLSNDTGYSGFVVAADAVRFAYVGTTGAAPVIAVQPQSQTVARGAAVTFRVAASGSLPFSYQWRFNGGNIPGETSSSYMISDVQTGDAGNYSVVVSNQFGSATSSNATLTLNVPPSITAQPSSQSVLAGANVTFSVTAAGTAPLYYQWRFAGVDIAAATASSYTRNNVQPADAGTYSVVVSNSAGSVSSAPAVLALNYTLTTIVSGSGAIYKNPDQASYASGTVATLVAAPVLGWSFSSWSGGASGAANPLAVTLANSLTITGSFTSTVSDIIVDNPQATTMGTWVSSTATDEYGSSYEYASATNGSANATATFTPNIVTAGNYDVYVWYPTLGSSRRSSAVPYLVSCTGGSTNVIVSQQSGAGAWHLIASAEYFTAGTSGFVRLSNNTGESSTRRVAADAVRWVYSANQSSPPVILAQPQSQTADVGSTAVFAASAAGTDPLSYQWRFNGTTITGATDSAYTLSKVQSGDAGAYSVVVSNTASSLTSSNAVLTVNVPPAIATQPQDQSVPQGSNALFTVVATGTPLPAYQWRFNGADLADATGSALALNNVQVANAGSYSVVISNIAGSVTSSNALLTVSSTNAPRIESIANLPDGRFQLQISGGPGNFAIEAAPGLSGWTQLSSLTATGALFQYVDLETNQTSRFYRVRQLP